jgi:hypothetical protein
MKFKCIFYVHWAQAIMVKIRHRVQHLTKLATFNWFQWGISEATHNFWILLTRHVTAALMSAGPRVLMTFCCRSCNLVASNEPWGSPTFTRVMWSGIEASSAGSTLDSCSVSCFRGTWKAALGWCQAKHCNLLIQGVFLEQSVHKQFPCIR